MKTDALFFDNKIRQSETVAAWSGSAIKKLKQIYVKLLIEAGLLNSAADKKIMVPMDKELEQRLSKIEPKVTDKIFLKTKGLGMKWDIISLIIRLKANLLLERL